MNSSRLFAELHEASNSLRCLRPISILSGSRRVSVPCGKCNACLKAKSLTASNKIQEHARNYKYCFFVTLTYAPEYAPYYAYQFDENDSFCECSRVLYRTVFRPRMNNSLYRRPEQLIEAYVNPAALTSFAASQLYSDDSTIMLCNIDDLQLFFKRLRKFYTYGNARTVLGSSKGFTSPESLRHYKSSFVDCFSLESRFVGRPFGEALKECAPSTFLSGKPDFSYYACAEYGGTTHRPHYHLLLFSNADYFACTLCDAVNQCWQYGRIDIQLSQGYAAQYVAGYLNASSLLPSFISSGVGRPFSVHSIYGRIPEEYRGLDRATYEKICAQTFDGTVVASSGRYVTRRLAPDLLHSLFLSPTDDVRRDSTEFVCLYQHMFSFFRYFSRRANLPDSESGIDPERPVTLLNPLFPQSVEPSFEFSRFILFDLFNSVIDANSDFNPERYNALPSFVRYIVEYLDIKPFLRSHHYFRSALDISSSPLLSIASGRVMRLLNATRTVLRVRRCSTPADFGELVRQSAEFWQTYYSRKLHDFYAKLETHSETYNQMMLRLSDMSYYNEVSDINDGDGRYFSYDVDTFIDICFDRQQKNFKPRNKHNPNV